MRFCANSLDELRYRFFNAKEQPVEPDERMKAFALRYAKRFARDANGSMPYGCHPMPNAWDPTFFIDFGGPDGFEEDEHRQFLAEQSGSRA